MKNTPSVACHPARVPPSAPRRSATPFRAAALFAALPLLLCACGGADSQAPAHKWPPAADIPPGQGELASSSAPSTEAAPPAAESVDPDTPSGADATRDAELAKKAAEVVDAFSNGTPRLTPDGKRVVFKSNRDGLPQLYIAELDKPEAITRLVTSKERVGDFRITADGKAIVFTSDKGADENYSLFRVGLDGKAAVELTPGESLHRDLPFIPEKAPDLLIYSARSGKETSTRVTVLKAGSSPKVAYTDPGGGGLAGVSKDGKQALFVRFLSLSDAVLSLVDLEKGSARRLYPAEGKTALVQDASFSADDSRVFVCTNGGEEKAILLALDAKSGEEKGRYVEDKPATADLTEVFVSKKDDLIGLSVSAGNRDEIRILDAKSLKLKAKSGDALGSGGLSEWSPDGKYLLGTWSTPASPNEIVRFSASDGKVEPLRKEARPTLAALPPVEASIVTIAAFDGGKIPVNLYLPPAAARAKPIPVLVMVHGGPAASSKIGWDPTIRFFSSQGFAIVQPNIRGSTGFGRAYEMADNGKKRLDALKDLESVAKWTQAQPWADPKRLIVYGGSYGGYMVLMGLTRQQSLWRAGVDLVGVSSWRSFMASTTGLIRDLLSKEFGNVEQDGEFLDSISPLKDISTITAPLFVYQGQNDPRVPRPESDQVVRSLRSRGVPVEYMVAPNEGHSLDRRENRIAFMSRVTRFLEKQLGGARTEGK